MKTLKGVIAASTGKGEVVPDESDLHMVPWYFVLSSGLYAIEFEDGIAPNIAEPFGDRRTVLKTQLMEPEVVEVGLVAPKIYRRNAVKYWDYKNTPPEAIGVGLLAPTISRKTEVRYLTYDKAEPEQLSVGLLPPAIFREKVADRFEYEIPEESISVGLLAPVIKRTNT